MPIHKTHTQICKRQPLPLRKKVGAAPDGMRFFVSKHSLSINQSLAKTKV